MFSFSPGTIHQEIALKKCVIIEVSSHLNDRVRVEFASFEKFKWIANHKRKEILKL